MTCIIKVISFFLVLFLASSSPSIYGVRWFLGDSFSISQKQTQESYFILSFNSEDRFEEDVFVQVSDNKYACSHRKIQVKNYFNHIYPSQENLQSTKVHIYKCFINAKIVGEHPYNIYTAKTVFQYSLASKSRVVRTQKNTLFKSQFRSVLRKEQNSISSLQKNQILVLGDWGQISEQVTKKKGYIPALQAILKDIQNPEIRLILFLGDISYTFYGQKYVSMLKYMQPLTSKLPFIMTPGNHDSVHHQDCFQLLTQTFYTPHWETNFNFYYSIVLDDIIILSFNSQEEIYSQNHTTNINVLELIEKDYPKEKRQQIKENYHVIVFSHYPIYCSDPDDTANTCFDDRQRLQNYMKIFQQLGMDIFLSGHLHFYERTHQICQENDQKEIIVSEKYENQIQIYDTECPFYIVDGATGNSEYVQVEKQFEAQNFTASLIYGTGYGTLFYDFNSQSNCSQRLKYEHYKMISKGEKERKDAIIKQLPDHSNSNASKKETIYSARNIMLIILIVSLGFIILLKEKKEEKRKQS